MVVLQVLLASPLDQKRNYHKACANCVHVIRCRRVSAIVTRLNTAVFLRTVQYLPTGTKNTFTILYSGQRLHMIARFFFRQISSTVYSTMLFFRAKSKRSKQCIANNFCERSLFSCILNLS